MRRVRLHKRRKRYYQLLLAKGAGTVRSAGDVWGFRMEYNGAPSLRSVALQAIHLVLGVVSLL